MFDPIKELELTIPVILHNSQELFSRLDFRNVDRDFVVNFIADLLETEQAIATAMLAYRNAESQILKLLEIKVDFPDDGHTSSESRDEFVGQHRTQIEFAIYRSRYFVRKVHWILADHFGFEKIAAIANEWPIDCRNAAALTVRLQRLNHDQYGKAFELRKRFFRCNRRRGRPIELWNTDFETFSDSVYQELGTLRGQRLWTLSEIKSYYCKIDDPMAMGIPRSTAEDAFRKHGVQDVEGCNVKSFRDHDVRKVARLERWLPKKR